LIIVLLPEVASHCASYHAQVVDIPASAHCTQEFACLPKLTWNGPANDAWRTFARGFGAVTEAMAKGFCSGTRGDGRWGTEKFAEKLVDMMKKSSVDQSSA
jgi:hypothetical protein